MLFHGDRITNHVESQRTLDAKKKLKGISTFQQHVVEFCAKFMHLHLRMTMEVDLDLPPQLPSTSEQMVQ